MYWVSPCLCCFCAYIVYIYRESDIRVPYILCAELLLSSLCGRIIKLVGDWPVGSAVITVPRWRGPMVFKAGGEITVMVGCFWIKGNKML